MSFPRQILGSMLHPLVQSGFLGQLWGWLDTALKARTQKPNRVTEGLEYPPIQWAPAQPLHEMLSSRVPACRDSSENPIKHRIDAIGDGRARQELKVAGRYRRLSASHGNRQAERLHPAPSTGELFE